MSNQASDDEKIAPEWMNERFFEDILRETEKDDSIEVTQVISKPGSNLGDHYASVMFRGLVTYKNSKSANLETSLIIKTMPFLDGPKRDLLQQSPIFNIEVSIYSDILPNFEKHLKDANDDCKLGCKCLFYSLHPHKTIVFEDLTKRQFYAPEPEQMTYDTAMKALEKLAKWHAISFKINKENGDISKQFGNGPFSNYFLESVPLFRDGFPFFFDMLKYSDDLKEYVPIFEKLISGNILRKSQEGFNAYLERANVNICVLNHGDAHLKNTMVKINSSGNVEDILWIDFQTCHFGPAVMDLMYFLYMSIIDHDTRINKREEIIYSYFKIFTQTLKNLGFDGELPKLVDLYKDFLTFKDYELLLVTTFLPMLFAKESNREADPAQVMDSADFRRNMYKNSNYQQLLKILLPKLLHKGYLD